MEISLKKSHIHILESDTLSRESRVTESAQEIVDLIPYICEWYSYITNCQHLYTFGGVILQESGKVSAEDTKYAEHYTSYGYSFRIYGDFEEIVK